MPLSGSADERRALFPRGMLAETIPAGSVLIRVHHRARDPVWFGPQPGIPPQHRFDAPAGEYRTLYCAARLAGAFVESVLRRPSGRIVARAYVEERAWTELTTLRAFRLACLGDRFENAGLGYTPEWPKV